MTRSELDIDCVKVSDVLEGDKLNVLIPVKNLCKYLCT